MAAQVCVGGASFAYIVRTKCSHNDIKPLKSLTLWGAECSQCSPQRKQLYKHSK